MARGCPAVVCMQLSAAGLPLAVMSDGTALAYSQGMAAWMRVADSAFPASPFHSMLQGPSGRDPPWAPRPPALAAAAASRLPRSAHCSRISGVNMLSLWRPTCASAGQRPGGLQHFVLHLLHLDIGTKQIPTVNAFLRG